MHSIVSRALVAVLCGLVAMNYYLMVIEPSRPDIQHGSIYMIVVGICVYLIVYAALSTMSNSRPNNKL